MRHPGNNLHKDNYSVRIVELKTCQAMVRRYHRQGGGSNTATFRHGLFHNDCPDEDCCMGIAWWIPPTKGAAIATYSGDWRRVLSLTRLVCIPDAPRNSASFLLSRSINMIKKDKRWECLVTYASQRFGHNGAIYKATNWERVGMTKPEATWVDREGQYVARKAGPKTRTKAEMEELGYEMIGRFAKIKYRMIL